MVEQAALRFLLHHTEKLAVLLLAVWIEHQIMVNVQHDVAGMDRTLFHLLHVHLHIAA